MRDISEAITEERKKPRDISDAAKDISDAIPEVPEFPLELLEQADVVPEEEQLGLMTEPQSFWDQLLYGQQRPPGAGNVPQGLLDIYRTADIGGEEVWQPLGAGVELMTPEQRQKALETIGIHKLIDITERPLYMAHNIAYMHAKSISEHGRFRPQEAPTFSDMIAAAKDGLRGNQYGSTLNLVKMGAFHQNELRKYNDFLERHTVARYIDKAADIGTEIAAAAILEAGYYKGIKAIATRTPGIRTLVKGMFNNVGQATLHRGFNDAVEASMEKSKLYQDVLAKLATDEEAAKTWVDQADEILRFVNDEGLTVKGVWPQNPSIREMMELAREYGIDLRILPRESDTFAALVRRKGKAGELIEEIVLREDAITVSGRIVFGADFLAEQTGQIFLHELGHSIYYRLPAEFVTEWDNLFRRARAAPDMYRFLPTQQAGRNPREAFAEVFALVNSGQAGNVPAETAAKFLSIMRDAGVDYVDVTKVVERAMGVEYINALVKTKSVTQDSINRGVKAVSMGKKSKLKQLNDVELKALVEDIVSVKAVGKTKLGITGRIGLLGLPTGGPPPWKMFENFGIPHGYDLVDEAMSAIQNLHMERGSWMKDVMRRYKDQFGKNWDDIADQVAGRIADEGPSAIRPGRFAMMTDDEVDFIRRIVDEDRTMFWESLADRAEQLNLIGEGTNVPRQEYYFHHRRKFIDAMKERARRKGEEITLGVLPSDYAVERITKEKIPKGVNVPEFFARRSEEAIEYDWRATTSIAYREELRKLYLEPSLRRLDFILEEMPGAYRKEARKYAHDWIRNVRGIPSVWDDRLNDFNYAIMRRIPGLKKTRLAAERGYEQMTKGVRRIVFTGTIGANSRTWVKQGFQSMLTVNTIGDKATYAGWESMFTEGGKRLLNQYRVMAGGRRLAMTDLTKIGKMERGLTLPFTFIDKYVNVAGAGNGAVYFLMSRSRKRMDELAEYAVTKGYKRVTSANFWDVMADAVDDGMFKDVVDAANKNIKYTQWSYNTWDMPRHLWSQTGKTMWMFTTWPSNFFGAHLPQLWTQLVYGENVFGQAVTLNQRLALIRYLGQTTAIVYLARKMGYNLDWLMATGPAPKGYFHGWMKTPMPVSPPSEFALSLGDMIVNAYTGDFKRMDDSLKLILRSMTPFVPAGTTIKRGIKWKKGEAPPEYIFLPKKLPPKRKPSPLQGLKGFGGMRGLED